MAVVLMGLLTGVASGAQPNFRPPVAPPINSDERGQALAREVRESMPESDARFDAILKTRSRDGTIVRVPVTGLIEIGSNYWKQVYLAAGTNDLKPQRLAILHHPGKPNTYHLSKGDIDSPASSVPDLSQPLGGSEFWVVDLGMDFLHWPFQRLIKTEMRKSRVCHVLESLNPSGAGYSRVLCWLDKEQGQPLLAEAYDAEDRLVKEFAIGSLKKIDGQWQIRDMKIVNVQTGAKTWLEFQFD